jgi:hypothetical protein
MASRRRAKVRSAVATVLSVALLLSAQAWSFGPSLASASVSLGAPVGPVAVTVPTVPVKAPTAPAKAALPHVEVPTVPVKTPTVPAKAALPHVEVPTVPVKAPTVPAKASLPPVEVPTVPVKTPTVPVKTPSVPVKAPAPPVKVPSVPVKAPTPPVKAPAPPVKPPTLPPVTTKAPSVSVKAPSTIPSLPVKAPSTPTGHVDIPGVLPAGSPSSGSPPAGSASSRSTSSSGSSSGSSTSGHAGSGSVAEGAASGGNGSAATGYGPGAIHTLSGAGTPGAVWGELSGDKASQAREQALRAAVQHLQGCLSQLPEKLRLTLQLRTGLGVPRALAPKALAARLHVKVSQVAGLETQALRELRAAGAQGCGEADGYGSAGTGYGSLAFVDFGASGGIGGPMGAVDAARYTLKPSGGSFSHLGSGNSLLGSALGADIPPAASDAILTLLLILAGALAISLLVATEAGRGPSYRRLRERLSRRPTRRP